MTNLATNASLDAKINEVKGVIPSLTNIATTAAFTTVENKIPNVSDLGKKTKKTDYDAKIKDTKNKYFTTSDYNKFINNIFNEKIKAKFLVNESDLTEKIKTLETKEEIKKSSNTGEI